MGNSDQDDGAPTPKVSGSASAAVPEVSGSASAAVPEVSGSASYAQGSRQEAKSLTADEGVPDADPPEARPASGTASIA